MFDDITSGQIFGLWDNGFVVVGVVFGLTCLERWIARSIRGSASPKACLILGAILGGGNANTISDFLGAMFDPALRQYVVGITIGTQYILIPFYFYWVYLFIRGRVVSSH